MLLDLEQSFEELKGLSIAKHLVLPINSSLEKFKGKIVSLKFPVWIKLNSSEHKLKLGGVKKCSNFEELEKVYTELKKKFPGKKFIIQENINGIQVILGLEHDKTFDRVLLLGSGGSSVEEKKDVVFRVLPLKKEEILTALKELKIYPELEKLNLSSLIDLIEKLVKLNLKEADLNPIVVNEKQAIIVDARLEIEDED